MKVETEIYSVNIGVYSKCSSAFTAKKSSPFYDKTDKGVLLDNSCTFRCVDCMELAEKETGLQISNVDLYYGFTFTVDIESHLEIPDAQNKLKQFVEKFFDDYEKK